jgi:hypothetical protein
VSPLELGRAANISLTILLILFLGRHRPCNDVDEGFRIGQAGFSMYDNFRVKIWLPRLSLVYYGAIHAFRKPLSTCFEPLLTALRVGIETGDVESAIVCGVFHCFCRLETQEMSLTDAGYEVLADKARFYRQANAFAITRPTRQFLHNLMGRGNANPAVLSGTFLSEHDFTRMRSTDGMIFVYTKYYMTLLAYLFGDIEAASKHSNTLRLALNRAVGAHDHALLPFLDGIVAIANFRMYRHWRSLRVAIAQMRRLRNRAISTPQLFLSRQFLLEAEIAAAIKGDKCVHSKYVAAIALARDSGSLFLAALGNELAGKYFLRKNQRDLALHFLQEAVQYYKAWGAMAKVDHLSSEMHVF